MEGELYKLCQAIVNWARWNAGHSAEQHIGWLATLPPSTADVMFSCTSWAAWHGMWLHGIRAGKILWGRDGEDCTWTWTWTLTFGWMWTFILACCFLKEWQSTYKGRGSICQLGWTLAGAKSGKQCGVSFEVLQLQAIHSKSVFRLPLNIHKCTFAWHLNAPNYSTYWWHHHQHSSVLWVHHYQQYITKTTVIISQLILLCLSTQGSTVSSMCKEVKSPKHCDLIAFNLPTLPTLLSLPRSSGSRAPSLINEWPLADGACCSCNIGGVFGDSSSCITICSGCGASIGCCARNSSGRLGNAESAVTSMTLLAASCQQLLKTCWRWGPLTVFNLS